MADEDIKITADAEQAKQELAELGEAADQASDQVEQVGEAGDEAGRGLGSVGEKAANVVGVIGLVAATFVTAYKTTRQAIDALKDYGINVDDTLQKFFQWNDAFDQVVNGLNTHARQVRESVEAELELANANNILTKRYGESYDSIEEARAALERHARAAYEDAAALEAANEAIFGNTDKLEKQTAQLALAVGAMLEHGATTTEQMTAARDATQKYLDAWLKSGKEIPPELLKIQGQLGVLSTVQEKAAKESEKLAETAAKAAQKRAEEEEKAVAREVAALEKRRQEIERSITDAQARLDAALAKGEKLDTSEDTSGLQNQLEDTQRQIEELEKTPIISPEQQRSLDEAKNKAADLNRELGDLNRSFIVSGDNFLDEAQAADAAAAAWDLYGAQLAKSQARHDQIIDAWDREQAALEGTGEALDDAGESAEDFGEAAEGAAEGVEALAEANKQLDIGTPEGLAQMLHNAQELKPELAECRDLLVQIRDLSAQVTL